MNPPESSKSLASGRHCAAGPLLLSACLAVAAVVSGARPASPAGDTRAAEGAEKEVLFPGDARLERKVTAGRGRVYLGELLEQLSAETRVPVKVDDAKGPVSGIDLTVYLHERPLREVMAGLARVFSHRRDRWSWRRSGNGYILRSQLGPGAAAAAARGALAARFAGDVRRFYEISRLPESQRSQQARQFPTLFPQGHLQGGKPDLLATLSPAQLEGVLRGEFAPLEMSNLPPSGRETLKLGVTPYPPSTNPRRTQPGFYLKWERWDLAPRVWLRNEFGLAGNAVGNAPWEWAWLRAEEPGWLCLDDPPVRALQQRRQERDPAAGSPLPLREPSLRSWIQQAAQAQQLNVIADPVHPGSGGGRSSGWLGRTGEQSVYALLSGSSLNALKEGETWLLRHQVAPIDPRRHLVPWETVRKLRQVAERNEGMLDLETIALLSELSVEQAQALHEEFPVADEALVESWRPALRFARKLNPQARARLQSLEGVPLPACGLVARQELFAGADPKNVLGLRLLEQEPLRASMSLHVKSEMRKEREGEKIVDREKRYLVWQVTVPEVRPHWSAKSNDPRRPLKPE